MRKIIKELETLDPFLPVLPLFTFSQAVDVLKQSFHVCLLKEKLQEDPSLVREYISYAYEMFLMGEKHYYVLCAIAVALLEIDGDDVDIFFKTIIDAFQNNSMVLVGDGEITTYKILNWCNMIRL